MQTAKWSRFVNNSVFNFEIATQHWNSTRVDPYLVWANITDYSYLNVSRINRKLPIAIELDKDGKYNNTAQFSKACISLSFIQIADVYQSDQPPYTHARYLTALVHERDFIEALNEGHDVLNSISRFQLGLS